MANTPSAGVVLKIRSVGEIVSISNFTQIGSTRTPTIRGGCRTGTGRSIAHSLGAGVGAFLLEQRTLQLALGVPSHPITLLRAFDLAQHPLKLIDHGRESVA
jgi:hypothetical protein